MDINAENSGQVKHFCTQCGNQIGKEDRFCGSCGKPAAPASAATPLTLQPQPSPQPVAEILSTPSAGKEPVTGVILATRKKSMFSVESFHIIVASKRMVFAAFTNEMVKQDAKEEGKSGFFSGVMGAMTLGYNYYKRYLDMDPDKALKENPQNFTIDISNIKKIKLELGRRQRDRQQNRDVWEDSKLEIETAGEKHSFKVAHHFHDMAQDVLHRARLI